MQTIAIDSEVKSTFAYSKSTQLLLAVFLFVFALRYFDKAWEGGWWLYYSLSVMTIAGAVLMVINYFKGPFLKITPQRISFKVNLRDQVHQISWDQLISVTFDEKIVIFNLKEGNWPVYFNCSKKNFTQIKKTLRYYAEQKGMEVSIKDS